MCQEKSCPQKKMRARDYTRAGTNCFSTFAEDLISALSLLHQQALKTVFESPEHNAMVCMYDVRSQNECLQ